jgi:uncharacterized membrane protein
MTTNRIEAFSDGVIAIIITIMVFDLKLPEKTGPLEANTYWLVLGSMLPKLASYVISFLVLAIMWVNHHQLFHQIRSANGTLLWLNIHLLFWMSLIPFSTNVIGANIFLAEANLGYGFIFLMNSLSFWLLRDYATHRGRLMHPKILDDKKRRAKYKSGLGVVLYALSMPAAYLSVYLSFILFIAVPAIYFVPEKIIPEDS